MGLIALVLWVGCRDHFDDVTSDAGAGDAAGDATGDDLDATMLDPDAAGCPASYTQRAGLTSKYRVVLAASTTWLEAEALCEADGTHLIVVDDVTENTFARSLNATTDEHVWMGGGDHVVEGTFGWVTGQPMPYTKWGGTEPNNTLGVEDCLEIDSNGNWNDERNAGGAVTYHTVCECDGVAAMPARYCDTDLDTSCGTCGTSCGAGLSCINQTCQ